MLDNVIGHSDDGIPLQRCPVCGPTLVVMRNQQPEEHICCRNCGGEFTLVAELGPLTARPIGRRASLQDLQPDADHELIRRVVSEAVDGMPLEEMLAID
ncbi:hypothetical protein D3C75_1215590 [compost metagenome]